MSASFDDKPLTGPQRVVRAVTFWSKVVPILAAYKAVEVTGKDLSEKELEAKYQELHEWGSERLENTIKELKGFYVKTGQVISTRVDLFPEQYTSRLQSLQDDLDPMPASVVREVISRELLQGEPLESIFASFDDKPLGAASIAQVHAATLRDGRKVAVKVQRPNCEPKLRGDIANLKSFSKKLASALPVDYYTVFCELERALDGELDFLAEAQAALKVYASVSHTADGKPVAPAVGVPLPVQGLASRRVLVMDFVEGTPLNRLSAEMEKRGIKPGSPESQIAGRRILEQLTVAFGRMMLGAGFIHGDPHPGNIFVQPGAKVALIDCGQVKQISTEYRLQLAEAILLVNEWVETGGSPKLIQTAQEKMSNFGVTFVNGSKPEAAVALALLLFADPDTPMPGGFSSAELSDTSPIKAINSFPQELVLLGRATILIKGIAKRLGIKWSLADKWKPAWSTDGLGVADGSIGDKFSVVVNGQTRQMTEIEARDALTKKVEAATAAGKGLDIERRGQFNEKALFSEDFYFKYGLRPTPDDMKAKPIDPDQMPFVPVQRRYTGYKKYQERVSQGIALYTGELRTLIQEGKWAELKPFLDIGTKGQGSNAQGEGTGVAASPMRSSCRALGLFANTVLQSDNDNGTTYANLLVRHFVNELYFALDDIAAAAAARDSKAAKLAWTRGRDYINTYLEIVNRNINAKVGDKFAIIDASL